MRLILTAAVALAAGLLFTAPTTAEAGNPYCGTPYASPYAPHYGGYTGVPNYGYGGYGLHNVGYRGFRDHRGYGYGAGPGFGYRDFGRYSRGRYGRRGFDNDGLSIYGRNGGFSIRW